jgi:hypothetical protein
MLVIQASVWLTAESLRTLLYCTHRYMNYSVMKKIRKFHRRGAEGAEYKCLLNNTPNSVCSASLW